MKVLRINLATDMGLKLSVFVRWTYVQQQVTPLYSSIESAHVE